MRLTVVGGFAFFVALSSIGCGGDSGGGPVSSCGTTVSCGGDIVGIWTVSSVCIDIDPAALGGDSLPTACQTAFEDGARAATAEPSLTMTFAQGGTYQEYGSLKLSMTYDYSADCLRALGDPPASDSTCATVAAGLGANYDQASCVYVSNVCRCSVIKNEYVSHAGTFRTRSGELFLDEASSSTSASGPYCVKDLVLTTTLSGPQGRIGFQMGR